MGPHIIKATLFTTYHNFSVEVKKILSSKIAEVILNRAGLMCIVELKKVFAYVTVNFDSKADKESQIERIYDAHFISGVTDILKDELNLSKENRNLLPSYQQKFFGLHIQALSETGEDKFFLSESQLEAIKADLKESDPLLRNIILCNGF